MDFETTFKENQQSLLNMARSYSLKCGNMIPTEDFYSQGCEIFIHCFNHYKPEKGKLSTYFIGSCKLFFKGMIVKETIRQINKISTKGIYIDSGLQERRVSFMDRLSKLSSDAIEVVLVVLKTPTDFIDDLSRSTIRSFFIKKWRGGGAQNRVTFAFDEIRQTLKDF